MHANKSLTLRARHDDGGQASDTHGNEPRGDIHVNLNGWEARRDIFGRDGHYGLLVILDGLVGRYIILGLGRHLLTYVAFF